MQWQWPCRHHLVLEYASNVCGAACAIYYCISLPLRLAFVPDFCLGPHHAVFIILDALATAVLLWKALDMHVLRTARAEARVVPVVTADGLLSKESKGSRRRPRSAVSMSIANVNSVSICIPIGIPFGVCGLDICQ